MKAATRPPLAVGSARSSHCLPAQVTSAVIGRGCRIGRGVRIEGSYVHDKVTVWEGAVVQSAMLCEGVTVMPNAKILPGAVISFKVTAPPVEAWNVPKAIEPHAEPAESALCTGCDRRGTAHRPQQANQPVPDGTGSVRQRRRTAAGQPLRRPVHVWVDGEQRSRLWRAAQRCLPLRSRCSSGRELVARLERTLTHQST